MARLLGVDPARAWDAVEENLRPAAADPRFDLLLRASQLAAQYGEHDLARAGVERHRVARERGRPLGRGDRAAYQAILLAIDLAAKSYERADATLRAFPWHDLPGEGWALNVRLLAATRDNDHAAVLSILRGPAPVMEPYERGNRLRILGRHFFLRGRWDKVAGCFRAALREYGRDAAADARLKEVEILGILGTAAGQEGRWEEAQHLLGRAIHGASRLRHPFYEPSFRIELAQMLSDRGEHARAGSMLRIVAAKLRRRAGASGADRFLLVAALLTAGGVAADAGDPGTVASLLAEAGALLASGDHVRLRAYWHLLHGRLLAAAGGDAHDGAAAELDEAKRLFHRIGDGDRLGLSRVALHRGHLHLKRRELAAAVARAVECMDFARQGKLLPIQARCLLLKSQLLLQREAPHVDRLYEEVLTSLGAIQSPIVLFKVIANLYLHSWELEEQVELTDVHLRQIHKMAEVLDHDTFHRLYEKHVATRVARRLLARSFGVAALPAEEEDEPV
jgi:hypothetical protein